MVSSAVLKSAITKIPGRKTRINLVSRLNLQELRVSERLRRLDNDICNLRPIQIRDLDRQCFIGCGPLQESCKLGKWPSSNSLRNRLLVSVIAHGFLGKKLDASEFRLMCRYRHS